MSALGLVNVSLEYADGSSTLKALDHVDLTVARGEFLSVVGPSGSGKSSLLAVASTLIVPTHGVVIIDGEDVTAITPAQRTVLRREKVGIVFQQPNLLPSLTAVEQLLMREHLRGKAGAGEQRKARELLDTVGLGSVVDRRPHQLSGGQRQRVNIARALMRNPSVLLVDEPTAALDHQRSESIVRLLRRITDEFATATVMVTHDTEFLPLTDAVAVMRDGRLSRERIPSTQLS
ncbi:ABC transporter ATP-binding protein [Paenarthrobacter ureafaciens]|uniref:ABC transporter ATP-binding protein n=1 Tax=Paenarthrobacter ureafaciens TaxID=37931 RepID=UPI00140C5B7D|nr:ABC transporter ATP-binding protein [Paenarthrobacter ureafaciens]MCX8454950.1 ABC transporter ATP-binding protein [Paenarthrobacter ureafaciens]MCY0974731.1 ABC transporter ATP-binding protein [Paenarthrobacter ureafaciens]